MGDEGVSSQGANPENPKRISFLSRGFLPFRKAPRAVAISDQILTTVLSTVGPFWTLAGILSILTLHASAFCVRINYSLWPLVDATLLSSVTLIFIVVAAGCAFIARALPIFIALLVFTFVCFGALTFRRMQHRRKRKLRLYDPYIFRSLVGLPNGRLESESQKSGLIWEYFRGIDYRRSHMRYGRRYYRRLGKKTYGLSQSLSYVVAFGVYAYYYSGFAFIIVFPVALYLGSIYLFAVFSSREMDRFLTLVSAGNWTAILSGTSTLNSRQKKGVFLVALFVASSLSAASGYGRFSNIKNTNPLAGETTQTNLAIIGTTSSGILVVLTDSTQAFIAHSNFGTVKAY